MFIIIIRGYNCKNYIDECVHSVLRQTEDDWRAQIIIDKSDDDSYYRASRCLCDKIRVSANIERMGVGANMIKGIEMAEPNAEDVVCILDADDYLLPNALESARSKYRKHSNCLVTYGSFILECTGKKSRICKPYKKDANVRKAKWAATHFKTFKYKVFKSVPVEYFQHNGNWFPAASDVALMIPLMEVAGLKNCYHVKQAVYFYRNHTDYSVNRGKQKKFEKIIRAKKPLKRRF